MHVVEVLVTGSLKNLLGPHHGNAQMPPGAKYDQFPYGLLEDFTVVRVD